MKPCLVLLCLSILSAMILGGCATGRYSVPDPTTHYEVREDKALVIFLRPSRRAGAVSSPVIEAHPTENRLVGVLGPREKAAYYTDPGETWFMVTSSSSDMVRANLEAGKVYYAIVEARAVYYVTYFDLFPFKEDPVEPRYDVNASHLRQWLDECAFVLPDEDALAYEENQANNDIEDRRQELEAKWQELSDQDRRARTITAEDGLSRAL